MSEENSITLYVSAGSNNSPYYEFYTDSEGNNTTNTLYLDKKYTFYRLGDATSHPFYISDAGIEQEPTANITLSGDGSYLNNGIVGTESLVLEFSGLTTSHTLYGYCTNHEDDINMQFNLVEITPEPQYSLLPPGIICPR